MKYLSIVLFALILILLIVLVFVLFVPVKIEFLFKKEQGKKLFSKLNISVFHGLIKFRAPYFSKKKKTKKAKKAKKTSAKKEQNDEQKDKKFLDRVDDLRILLKRLSNTYSNSRKFVRKRFIAEKFDFNIKFGLFDAAQTGIATGAVWTAIYSFFGFATQIAIVKKHSFTVTPVFDKPCFEFDCNGIINAKLVNIINMAFIIFIKYKKSK